MIDPQTATWLRTARSTSPRTGEDRESRAASRSGGSTSTIDSSSLARPGRRDWYANVTADPNVVIHVGGHDLAAVATPVRDTALRAQVFDDPQTRWYSSQTQRQRLIDESPMVEITF